MWQRIIETFKWAYARRTELGDPDFVKGLGKSINISGYLLILKTIWNIRNNQMYLRIYNIRLISINYIRMIIIRN